MLYAWIVGIGAFLMLSLVVAIFVGAAIHEADVREGWADDDDY